ncbi:MAG: trypsin-like peptidase domain-containing protein [Gemmataceae bacterium]
MIRTPARCLGILAIALSLLFSLAPAAQAQRGGRSKGGSVEEFLKSSPKVTGLFKDVINKASHSTVRIRAEGKDIALGTIVGPEGWILTKASELDGVLVCRLKDGREHEARIVGVHETFDLALLKIEARGLVAVKWQESQVAPVGHWVASAGIVAEPVAIGVVSVAARDMSTRRTAPAPTSGFLGVSMEPDGGGVKISQVVPGSAAAKAGLKVDDLILSCAKKEVDKPESLVDMIGKLKPGDKIELRIKRGEKEIDVTATLGRRPANRSDFQNRLGSELSDRRNGFPRVLQHDSVIKPSDCGGPLVDIEGRVIGINIARAGRTESYAIPSETVLPLMYDLMSGKLAPKDQPRINTDNLAPEKKLEEARKALSKAEADKAAAAKVLADAQKKLDEAKKAVERAQAEVDALKTKKDEEKK